MSTLQSPAPPPTAQQEPAFAAKEPPTVQEPPRVTGSLRAGFLLVLIPFVTFIAACTLYNAPPSPASSRTIGTVQSIMNPYFWQDWQLFGPTPGSNIDLLQLETRLVTPAGQSRQTQPVEVEDAVDRAPRAFRLNPTKLPGLFLAFDESAGRYSQLALQIGKLPAAQRPAAQHRLDEQFATDFLQLQRFLSARAADFYPGQRIVSVRATFESRAIVPFSQRYQHPRPAEPAKPILETSWMPYISGVAR